MYHPLKALLFTFVVSISYNWQIVLGENKFTDEWDSNSRSLPHGVTNFMN